MEQIGGPGEDTRARIEIRTDGQSGARERYGVAVGIEAPKFDAQRLGLRHALFAHRQQQRMGVRVAHNETNGLFIRPDRPDADVAVIVNLERDGAAAPVGGSRCPFEQGGPVRDTGHQRRAGRQRVCREDERILVEIGSVHDEPELLPGERNLVANHSKHGRFRRRIGRDHERARGRKR